MEDRGDVEDVEGGGDADADVDVEVDVTSSPPEPEAVGESIEIPPPVLLFDTEVEETEAKR